MVVLRCGHAGLFKPLRKKNWIFSRPWLTHVPSGGCVLSRSGSFPYGPDGATTYAAIAMHDTSQRAASSMASDRRRPQTALFFPGQGVQRVGMTTPWVEAFPRTCKPFLDELDHIVCRPLARIIAEGPNSTLTATQNAQPAIMATSIMILRILEDEFGFKTSERVDVTLGHSLGEFAALVAGGLLSYTDALTMVQQRADVMSRCSQEACLADGGEYGMIALVCEPDRLSSLIAAIHDFLGHASPGSKADSSFHTPPIEQVLIANINSKNQIVLSGNIERINTLLVQLRQFGGHDPRAVKLKSDSPFHSPIMAPAAKMMREVLANTTINFPGIFPCISNISARPFESAHDVRNLLARQAIDTILWWDSIKYLDHDRGVRRWIGLGPGHVGRNLVGKEVGMKGRDLIRGGGVWGISGPKEVEAVLEALDETEIISADEEKT